MRVHEKESSWQSKHRLRSSAELSMYRTAIVLELLFSAVIVGMFLFLSRQYSEITQTIWIMAALLSPCCLVPIGICLLRMALIWRRWERYTYHQVKLVNLHRTLWAEYSYFTVALDDGDGGKRIVNTHSIFTTHSLFTPHLEDYAGKTAVVGYNEETGQVVFLG